MKLFECQACGNLVYFENVRCERCRHRLGFDPDAGVVALQPDGGGWLMIGGPARGRPVRLCDNARHGACNWLVPADGPEIFCLACRHNRVIPDLSQPANVRAWTKLEAAKHRLFYGLLRWELPLSNRIDDPTHGLQFDFLSDDPDPNAPKVMTGHDEGRITIAVAEADDAERERRRASMGEPYRTLLGHFRHEVGHCFWDVLVRDGGRLEDFRAVFGDDREDYAAALQRHYDEGPPADWHENYISVYASTHAWEDWAETWAHYLHIVDTLDTATAFGIGVAPTIPAGRGLTARPDFDPYAAGDAGAIVDAWLPVATALNNLNRSMGHEDFYPFVLSPTVMRKLSFVHGIVHGG